MIYKLQLSRRNGHEVVIGIGGGLDSAEPCIITGEGGLPAADGSGYHVHAVAVGEAVRIVGQVVAVGHAELAQVGSGDLGHVRAGCCHIVAKAVHGVGTAGGNNGRTVIEDSRHGRILRISIGRIHELELGKL